jgi:hypothetical protein
MVKDHSMEGHNAHNMARGHNMVTVHNMAKDLSMVAHNVHSMVKDLNMVAHNVHNMGRDSAHNMVSMQDMAVHNTEGHHTESHKVVRRTGKPMIHRQNTL